MGQHPGRGGPVRLLVLGPVTARRGAEELRVTGDKQRLVLAHLCLADGRAVSVDRLAADIWEESRPRKPGHALQAHVSRLRQVLPVPIEFVDGAGYRIDADAVTSDAADFLGLCARAEDLLPGDPDAAIEALDEALALWRGPVVGDLGDVPGLRPHVLRLEEARRSAVARRIDAHLAAGRAEEVVGELRAAVDLDPLRDRTWAQLMSALRLSGRPNEAVVAYHRAREIFIEELGTEPAPHLAELHTQILREEPWADTGPRVAPVRPADPPSVTLLGRTAELSVLRGAWEESRAGLRIVTVTGEPGVGKTRLVTEVARLVRAAGGLALEGLCHRSGTLPYQPLADMLRARLDHEGPELTDLLGTRHGTALMRVAPELADLHPAGPDASPAHASRSAEDDYRTMDAIAAWLAELSVRTPLALVVDDLHWADQQTLRLLEHLRRSPRDVRALVLLAVRDRSMPAGSTAATDLLRQSDTVTHLPLERLGEEDTERLLQAEVTRVPAAAALPDWASGYVLAASGGNPLFVVELARHLAAGGLRTADHPVLPAGLRQVIEARVEALPPEVATTLREAAVIGTTLDSPVLADVAGLAVTEVERRLAAAVHAQLLDRPRDGQRYRFSHDVVRNVLSDSLVPAERAALHGRVARALLASGAAEEGHHRELAHHLVRSDAPDGPLLAVAHLETAARRALAAGAPAEAELLASEALAVLDPDGAPERRCDLLITLGTAQLRGAHPGYRDTLLSASSLARDLDDAKRLTAAVLANHRGWWSSTVAIDHDRVAMIEAALTASDPEDRAVRSQLLSAWASENVREPSLRAEVLARSAEAVELAEETGDPDVLSAALSFRYTVLTALSEDPWGCRRLADRLHVLAHRTGDRGRRLGASLSLAQASMRIGDAWTADRHLTQAVRLAEATQHLPRLWLARGWAAMRLVTRGRLTAAEQMIAETRDLGIRAEQADAGIWAAGQMFTLRLMQGRLPEMAEAVDDQVQTVAGSIPAWRAAMALVLSRAGRDEEATGILTELAKGAVEQLPHDLLRLHGLVYLAMVCEDLGRADLAPPLYEVLLPHAGLVATNGTIDAGPVDLQLGALARLLERPRAAEQHLHAAAELSRRIDAPLWLEQAEQRRRGVVRAV